MRELEYSDATLQSIVFFQMIDVADW